MGRHLCRPMRMPAGIPRGGSSGSIRTELFFSVYIRNSMWPFRDSQRRSVPSSKVMITVISGGACVILSNILEFLPGLSLWLWLRSGVDLERGIHPGGDLAQPFQLAAHHLSGGLDPPHLGVRPLQPGGDLPWGWPAVEYDLVMAIKHAPRMTVEVWSCLQPLRTDTAAYRDASVAGRRLLPGAIRPLWPAPFSQRRLQREAALAATPLDPASGSRRDSPGKAP